MDYLTIGGGYQPPVPMWPEKNVIELPVVKGIPLINPSDRYLKRLWAFLTKRPKWIVHDHYFCYIDHFDAWMWIPPNFVYDFASVPKAIPLVNPAGVFAYPALPHDCIYRFGCLMMSRGPGKQFVQIPIDREEGDKIFLDLAKKANGLGVLDNISTGMLRTFGGSNYKPRDIKEVDWNSPVYSTTGK